MQGKKVLITGGLGAIGSALCRTLLSKGVERITIIDDCSSSSHHLSADILSDERVTWFQKSVLSEECLRKAFLENGQDVVFHLAAHFANQNSVDHPIADCEVNSLGTTKVLEYSRLAGVSKFVFASSSCVYGNGGDFNVNTPYFHLDTPYAINKLHGEYLVRFYGEYHKMNVTVLRYFNSFGPGELPGRYRNVVPNFFMTAMAGQPLPITGNPEATRDFNYIDNVIQGTLLAAESANSSGKTYNIGSGVETTICALAETINCITGNAAGIVQKEKRAWDTVERRKADISKTVEELGYAPVIDLENQMKATHDWMVAKRHFFPHSR